MKLLQTTDYLIAVDDSKIEAGNKSLLILEGFQDGEPMILSHWQGVADGYLGKKITHHLPLNNAPVLEGVHLLPPLEDEEYDFAEIFYNICKATIEHFDDWVEAKEYNKSKAKEKYKYTEEDLRKCWKACLDFNKPAGSDSGINLEDFIQSLQQPKLPIAFDTETKQYIYE